MGDAGPCALLDNGGVKCWGLNSSGQLGQGDTDNRGDSPGELGDALLPIDLGAGRTAVAITGGNVHNCARLDDDSVKCWGSNNAGGLGLGDTDNRGDGPGEMGDALPAVAVVTPAPAMTASLAASPASVPVGATVDVSLSVQNTGNVGLTGFSVTPSSLSCPSLPSSVVPGASTVIACTYLTTVDDVGSLALSASVDTAQTSPVATNTENVTVVDETDPSVTITSPADGATVERGAVVNAGFSCADEVALDTCVGDVADGSPIDTSTLGSQEFSVTATDEAGNSVTVTHGYTVVDGTDPSVTITAPVDGATYFRTEVVTADFACADEVGGSGLDTCVGDVADGAPLDTDTLGPHTFAVTATDDAGNTTTVEHTYTVVDAVCFDSTVDVYLGLGDTPTSGDDVILGTPEDDEIDGLAGADVICGRAGEDTIRGGAGRDRIRAGVGDDTALAGPDGGLLAGNDGQDHLTGGAGDDGLRGGPDADTIIGGPGNDTAWGGAGTDSCRLAPGVDTRKACES